MSGFVREGLKILGARNRHSGRIQNRASAPGGGCSGAGQRVKGIG
jgi:hypothetical protein